MSILCLYASKNRASICVDTAVGTSNGARFAQTKLMPLAHVPCVLAVSGATELLAAAYAACCYGAWSYERLVKELPSALLEGLSNLIRKDPGDAAVLRLKNRFALVGWSTEAQSMLPTIFQYEPASDCFSTTHVSWFAAPAEALESRRPGISTDVQLLSVARAQVRWVKASWATLPEAQQMGGEPIAGRELLLASIDRCNVSVRKIPL